MSRPDDVLTTPPELAGVSADQLRFYRLVEERSTNGDKTQDIILACGHGIHLALELPALLNYVICVQCKWDWIAYTRLHIGFETVMKTFLLANRGRDASEITAREILAWSVENLQAFEKIR